MQSSPQSRASSSTASSAFNNVTTTPKSGKHQQQRRHQQQQQQQHQRKAQSMSPQSQATAAAFANSSICSSPSARNVPMPPEEWLNQLHVPTMSELPQPSRPSSSVSNASSSTHSTSPSLIGSSLSSIEAQIKKEKHSEHRQMMGVRVCPLQLIAAVASA